MPRGRRRASTDISSLEQELLQLKQRQAELRQQIRNLRGSQTSISKLEEKLEKQLSGARWLAQEIRKVRSDWDEIGFYQSVEPRQPKPRGRRPRSAMAAAEA